MNQWEVRPESKVAGSRAMEDSPVTKKTINENYNIMKIKVEQESQQEHVTSIQSRPVGASGNGGKRAKADGSKTSEINQSSSSATSKDGNVVFRILNQPESQHRARYQTEGSRGAIKDKAGTGHPSVRIDGYSQPAKIQIFIGTDTGKISPHLFYQVCRVTGKHSSPCEEIKINGTDVIEIISDPVNDNTVICDCVGILKERFADVEQRFPKHKNWKILKRSQQSVGWCFGPQ